MKRFFKSLLSFITISSIAFTSTACSSPNNTSQLNVFTWAGYVPDEVVADFEKETGIKINYSYFDTNEEMLSKIQAQKNQYDIIICSDYIIDVMSKEGGLLKEIDFTKIPNAKNIDPAYQNSYYDPENKYTIPYSAATEIIVYDSAKVDFEIKGIKDLWNPVFKDKLVVLDGERDIIGMTEIMLGYSVNETDPTKLELVKESLMELKPNIVAFDANTPHNSLINGDAIAGYMFGSQATEAMASIPTLKFVYPEEGAIFYVDNIILPAGAPNEESAYTFMNYVLDGKNSAKISSLVNYPNCNLAAKEFLPQSYLDNKAVNVDTSQIKNIQTVQGIGEASVLYDEIWTKFKNTP